MAQTQYIVTTDENPLRLPPRSFHPVERVHRYVVAQSVTAGHAIDSIDELHLDYPYVLDALDEQYKNRWSFEVITEVKTHLDKSKLWMRQVHGVLTVTGQDGRPSQRRDATVFTALANGVDANRTALMLALVTAAEQFGIGRYVSTAAYRTFFEHHQALLEDASRFRDLSNALRQRDVPALTSAEVEDFASELSDTGEQLFERCYEAAEDYSLLPSATNQPDSPLTVPRRPIDQIQRFFRDAGTPISSLAPETIAAAVLQLAGRSEHEFSLPSFNSQGEAAA